MFGKSSSKSNSDYKTLKNWYADRYQISLIQRNFLFIFCIIAIITVIFSLAIIKSIIEKNSIEPYIIKVGSNQDLPVTVSTQTIKQYATATPLVVEYFLTQYIKAREEYTEGTYKYNYGKVVRLMSSPQVFSSFKAKYVDAGDALMKQYRTSGVATVEIRQVVPNTQASTYIFRINRKVSPFNTLFRDNFYQITIKYTFDTSNLTYEDSMINPLGLKIISYQMLDEKNINGA